MARNTLDLTSPPFAWSLAFPQYKKVAYPGQWNKQQHGLAPVLSGISGHTFWTSQWYLIVLSASFLYLYLEYLVPLSFSVDFGMVILQVTKQICCVRALGKHSFLQWRQMGFSISPGTGTPFSSLTRPKWAHTLLVVWGFLTRLRASSFSSAILFTVRR